MILQLMERVRVLKACLTIITCPAALSCMQGLLCGEAGTRTYAITEDELLVKSFSTAYYLCELQSQVLPSAFHLSLLAQRQSCWLSLL